MNGSSELLPEDQALLRLLREHLHQGRASLMVGAGMSLNAQKIRPSPYDFPLWPQLANLMRQDLRELSPRLQSASDASVIAQHYSAKFGPAQLDAFLLKHIPDDNFRPAPLHQTLLRLPWADVFTTNYDTLLERTLPSVHNRRYDLILTLADIARKSPPRIIKLNGSFPSHTPFIITEEHFLAYPYEYAPFVNTVQQALMETSLCMIGFSGDDPNFKAWTYWVKRNLGQNARPVYLIGVYDITTHERSFFASRNVQVLDLGPLFPKTGSPRDANRHSLALTWLLRELGDNSEGPRGLNWPFTAPPPPNAVLPSLPPPLAAPQNTADSSGLQLLLTLKSTYPGWVICPHEKRTQLIRHAFRGRKDIYPLQTSPIDTIAHWATLAWFDQNGLHELYDAEMSLIEGALDALNPDRSNPDWPGEHIHDTKRGDVADVIGQWLSLAAWLAEKAITAGDINKAQKWFGRAMSVAEGSTLWQDRLAWIQWRLEGLNLSYSGMQAALNNWGTTAGIEWNVMQAILHAEMGDRETAHRNLELCLTDLRQMDLSVTSRFDSAALESLVMTVLARIPIPMPGTRLELGADAQRVSALENLRANALSEIAIYARYIFQDVDPVTVTRAFDIGAVRQTVSYGISPDAVLPEEYISILERSGLTFTTWQSADLAELTFMSAVKRIARQAPRYALFLMFRVSILPHSFESIMESVFSRSTLLRIDNLELDSIAHRCMTQIQKDLLRGAGPALARKPATQAGYPISARMLHACICFVSLASTRLEQQMVEDAGRVLCICYLRILDWNAPDLLASVSKGIARCLQALSGDSFCRLLDDVAALPIATADNWHGGFLEPLYSVAVQRIEPHETASCTSEDGVVLDRVLQALQSENKACRGNAVVRGQQLLKLGYFSRTDGLSHALLQDSEHYLGPVWRLVGDSPTEGWVQFFERWITVNLSLEPIFEAGKTGQTMIQLSAVYNAVGFLTELAAAGKLDAVPSLELCETLSAAVDVWHAKDADHYKQFHLLLNPELKDLVLAIQAYWRDFVLPACSRYDSPALTEHAKALMGTLQSWGLLVGLPLCVDRGWIDASAADASLTRALLSTRAFEVEDGYTTLDASLRALRLNHTKRQPSSSAVEIWSAQLQLRREPALFVALSLLRDVIKRGVDEALQESEKLIAAVLAGIDRESVEFPLNNRLIDAEDEKRLYDVRVVCAEVVAALARSPRWNQDDRVEKLLGRWLGHIDKERVSEVRRILRSCSPAPQDQESEN